jgi:outer membrane protein, multidrug efflux system
LVGLDLAYEVDVFGARSAGARADEARLGAAGFDLDAVALLVEAETASTYVEFLALDARVALLDKGLANARELERIIAVRVREGIATRVELGLQTIEVRQIEADRASLLEARDAARNALAVLTGSEAPLFRPGAEPLSGLTAPHIAALQPAELLVRRPDVRAAEMLVAAADGDVTAARRAFLPSLSISAAGVLGDGGFNPLSIAANSIGSLVAAVFDGGRRRGTLVTAAGEQHEAVAQYHKALLVGLQETEDALSAIHNSGRRLELLAATEADAARTAQLARTQFIEGAADARTVLEAERGLLDIEEAHALAQRDRLKAAFRLFRAMGGFPRAGQVVAVAP